jgi:hypothetical protein
VPGPPAADFSGFFKNFCIPLSGGYSKSILLK